MDNQTYPRIGVIGNTIADNIRYIRKS